MSRWNVGDVETRCAWVEKHAQYEKKIDRIAVESVRKGKVTDTLSDRQQHEVEAAEEEAADLANEIEAGKVPGYRTKWVPQVLEAIEKIWETETDGLTKQERCAVLFDPCSVRYQTIMDSYASALIDAFPTIANKWRLFKTDAELDAALDRIRFMFARRDRPRLPIITAMVLDDMYSVFSTYSEGIKECIRWIDPWIDFVSVPSKRTPELFDRTFNVFTSLAAGKQVASNQCEAALLQVMYAILEDRIHRLVPLDIAVRREVARYPFITTILTMPIETLSNVSDPSAKATRKDDKAFFLGKTPAQLKALSGKLMELFNGKVLAKARNHNTSLGWIHFSPGLDFFTAAELEAYPMLYMMCNSLFYSTILPLCTSAPRDLGARIAAVITLWSWYINVTLPLCKHQQFITFREIIRRAIESVSQLYVADVPLSDDDDSEVMEIQYRLYTFWDRAIRASLLSSVEPMEGVETNETALKAVAQATIRNEVVASDVLNLYKAVRKMPSAWAKQPAEGSKKVAPVMNSRVLEVVKMLASALHGNMDRQWMRTFPQNDDIPILEHYDDDAWEPPRFTGKTETDAIYFPTYAEASDQIDDLPEKVRDKVQWQAKWETSQGLRQALTLALSSSSNDGDQASEDGDQADPPEYRRPGVSARVGPVYPRMADVRRNKKGKGKLVLVTEDEDVDISGDPLDSSHHDVTMADDVGQAEGGDGKDEDGSDASGEVDEDSGNERGSGDDADESGDDDNQPGSGTVAGGGGGREHDGEDLEPQPEDADPDQNVVPRKRKRHAVNDTEQEVDIDDSPSAQHRRHRTQPAGDLDAHADGDDESDDTNLFEPRGSPTQVVSGAEDVPEIGQSVTPGASHDLRDQVGSTSPDVHDPDVEMSDAFAESQSLPPSPPPQQLRRSRRFTSEGPPTSSKTGKRPRSTSTYVKGAKHAPVTMPASRPLAAIPERPQRPSTPALNKGPVSESSATSKPHANETKRTRSIVDEHISSSDEDETLLALLKNRSRSSQPVASSSRRSPSVPPAPSASLAPSASRASSVTRQRPSRSDSPPTGSTLPST
ncbi:hypothetical protein EIP91_004927 [Steccherinum ochraceum]|uniref:Uncharacterized protein n=1 Tax=Steccherinum ochraceum TaxID=92696 RepID=A0A4R0RE31_9APHY|nr:hypothetical protein EIP91_004927 [Steccherinum ochraceum]